MSFLGIFSDGSGSCIMEAKDDKEFSEFLRNNFSRFPENCFVIWHRDQSIYDLLTVTVILIVAKLTDYHRHLFEKENHVKINILFNPTPILKLYAAMIYYRIVISRAENNK